MEERENQSVVCPDWVSSGFLALCFSHLMDIRFVGHDSVAASLTHLLSTFLHNRRRGSQNTFTSTRHLASSEGSPLRFLCQVRATNYHHHHHQ